MANFTETQITDMMKFIKDYGGINPDYITRELAILELKDLKRKGCTCESIGRECMGCSAKESNHTCPMNDWEKRHPEYANDELAMKIKVLEAGGEEAYQKKLEAKKQPMKYTIDVEHCLVGNGQEIDEYRIMDADGNIAASTYDKNHAEDILKLANERW